MASSSNINVGKLLRVLVAGGLGLAGVAGATRADEKAPAPEEKTDKAKEKEKDKADAKAKAEKEKKAQKEKKPTEENKEAGSDGGGVQGW